MEKKETLSLNGQPNVSYLTTLRNSGYNNYTAIADIVDNSLDSEVNTKNVYITIKKKKGGDDYDFIRICDDGNGMSLEILKEAFKLGANTGKSKDLDLGCYGTGLKASALSMGTKFEVSTKSSDDNFYIATYDLEYMIRNNTFDIPVLNGTNEDYENFKKNVCNETGTIITLYSLDRISNSNLSAFKDTLINKLGMYYKYFIDELNVNIFVNNEKVVSIDPMLRKKPYTKCMSENETFVYKNNNFKFSVYNIEFVSSAISNEINRNSANAGLYIYRNNRMVGSGLDLGIIGKLGDGHLNGLRIELFVNGECDEQFGSTFNKLILEKDKNEVDQGLRDICREYFKGYVQTVKNKETTQNSDDSVNDEVKNDIDETFRTANSNPFVGIKKERGQNNKHDNPTTKIIKDPGTRPGQVRTRDTKFTDYRFVKLGENGTIFRCAKEQGLYIVEINQEHPFWYKFLSKANKQTKDVVVKMLISMGVSLQDTDYYDDIVKETLLNEYFIKVSEKLRKFINY